MFLKRNFHVSTTWFCVDGCTGWFSVDSLQWHADSPPRATVGTKRKLASTLRKLHFKVHLQRNPKNGRQSSTFSTLPQQEKDMIPWFTGLREAYTCKAGLAAGSKKWRHSYVTGGGPRAWVPQPLRIASPSTPVHLVTRARGRGLWWRPHRSPLYHTTALVGIQYRYHYTTTQSSTYKKIGHP